MGHILFVQRCTITAAAIVTLTTPALAAPSEVSTADTAWMMVATALALMMTIPGLALFYSGMVRNNGERFSVP
jgi:ammonium transporter, Amt family